MVQGARADVEPDDLLCLVPLEATLAGVMVGLKQLHELYQPTLNHKP